MTVPSDYATAVNDVENEAIRTFTLEWADVTTPERIEVVSADDDTRLIDEALEAGELLPAGQGRYYSRSHPKDTARSEERTVVATGRSSDKGCTTTGSPPMRSLIFNAHGCVVRRPARQCTSCPT